MLRGSAALEEGEEMQPKAIIYTSQTGFTERYARMLSRELHIPCYSADIARANLKKKTPVIYFGWVKMGSVVGYKAVARRFDVLAVCPVCDNIDAGFENDVRAKHAIPEDVPVFALLGGLDFSKLSRAEAALMKAVTFAMARSEKNPGKKAVLKDLHKHGADYVDEKYLLPVIAWAKG